MTGKPASVSRGAWLEPAMAAGIVAGIVYCAWHLFTFFYLPAPFFYEPTDTYADWFNPAFWSRNEGAYDVWQSVYPPLSFVFLRVVGLSQCYPQRGEFDASAGLAARDCDWLGLAAIWMLLAIDIALCWLTFRRIDRKTALPRTICVGLGMPMLDAVERGNLMLVSIACMMIAYGPLVKHARLRWIAAGLAVNFKVYLVATVLPLLLKRRWRWVESALIATVLIYLFSYALLGHGTPAEIIANIRAFSNLQAANILDAWYTTTYQTLASLLDSDTYPLIMIIGSRNVEILEVLLPGLLHGTQALIALAAISAWLRPESVPLFRVVNLGLMMALITSEPGPYAQAYFMYFVMMERWSGFGRCWAIFACYLLALPLDIHLQQLPEVARDSYFGDTTVLVNFYINLGTFLRPLLVMSVAWGISLVTVRRGVGRHPRAGLVRPLALPPRPAAAAVDPAPAVARRRRTSSGAARQRMIARANLRGPDRTWPTTWRIALAAVVIGALALRLRGIAFGLPALNDPDELIFELGALRMLRGPTLNPGWFGHPATTTIYLLALLNAAIFGVGRLAGWFSSGAGFAAALYHDPGIMILPGRVMIALFGTLSVWLTARLANQLFDRRVALAAAALLAADPLHVGLSQLIRSDMMATCLMLVVMMTAIRIARDDRWRDYVVASVWLGAAIVSKWPFALSGFAVAGAVVSRRPSGSGAWLRALRRLVLFGLMALGFGLLISPFIVLDYPMLISNLLGEAQPHHLGATGGDFWHNAWFYLGGPITDGLGAAGLLLVAIGLAVAARERRLEAAAILLPVAVVFFLLICAQRLIWTRWALPLMPIAVIFAGLGFVRIAEILYRSAPARIAAAATAAMALFTLLPLVLAIFANAAIHDDDTRQRAAVLARRLIPAGSTVMVEHFAFDLLDAPWQFLFPLGDAGCVDARAFLAGTVKYSRIETERNSRSNVDYGTLLPERRGTCRPDYAILTQYDRYAAERNDFPSQFAAYRALLDHATIIATVRPQPGVSSGPVVRIVDFTRNRR